MRHITVAILTLTLVGGCVVGDNEVTEVDAVIDLAPEACERMYRCDHAGFHSVFPTVEACVEHLRESAEGVGAVAVGEVEACGEWLARAACDADPAPCAWNLH